MAVRRRAQVPPHFWSDTPEGWAAREEWAASVLQPYTKDQLIGALADIMQALYPLGDPEAEWDADTIDDVNRVTDALGLTPPDE